MQCFRDLSGGLVVVIPAQKNFAVLRRERGQRRVATYFLHEQMLTNYRALYDETACAFNLPREGE